MITMKHYRIYVAALVSVLMLAACEKSPIIDGGLSSENVNMTTYDFLKTHPRQMFDTTLLIIDKAGLKETINGSGTYFVPTDYSIVAFLNKKRDEARKKDERLTYTLDSLFKYFSPKMLKDSMGMYFFPEKIVRDNLNEAGKLYQSATPGVTLDISLEERDQYTYGGIITNKPKYIYLNKVLGVKDVIVNSEKADPSGTTTLKDIKALTQTSGLITTNGVVHVLENKHIWTFKQ